MDSNHATQRGFVDAQQAATLIKHKVLFVVLFGVAYTLFAVWAMVAAMGAAMSGFEPATTETAALTQGALNAMADGLMLPLVPMLRPTGLWTYPVLFGNGVMWGAALVAVWSIISRRSVRT